MSGYFPNTASLKLSNYFTVTADMTSNTWNTQATHEIATVTGAVYMRILPECTGTLTDATDTAAIKLGKEGGTASLIASTSAAGLTGTTISALDYWVKTAPVKQVTQAELEALFFLINNDDIGYEITGEALTGGTMVFHVWWEPANATGLVVAGAGGAL